VAYVTVTQFIIMHIHHAHSLVTLLSHWHSGICCWTEC